MDFPEVSGKFTPLPEVGDRSAGLTSRLMYRWPPRHMGESTITQDRDATPGAVPEPGQQALDGDIHSDPYRP
jgi:hypothetical protein